MSTRPREDIAELGLQVPFIDLRATNAIVRDDVMATFGDLIHEAAFIGGEPVGTFERDFARFCGVRHCVGVSSGLDALRLALLASGLRPGEEVIVPAQTFVATFEAVTQAGGVPVVVDVREADYNLDPDGAAAAVTSRTRILLPVHLYGLPADMSALRGLTAETSLMIVEDACQAHGAQRDGIRAGAGGTAAAFSFYPTKNLGAMGDAGAVVTDDEMLARRVEALREHGQVAKYDHRYEGYTARIDALQAAALSTKLPHVDEWNVQRAAAAAFYTEALDGVGDLRLPPTMPNARHVWHLYVIRTADPVGLGDFLAQHGVATQRHYPTPPHLSMAYAHLGLRAGQFPVAEALAREALSLPLYPGIGEPQLARVVELVEAYFRSDR